MIEIELESRDVQIRRRLAEIADRAAALAPEDFAFRHNLACEADALRAELHELMASAMEEVAESWAERAGRKGAHEPLSVEAKTAAIQSPLDAGG